MSEAKVSRSDAHNDWCPGCGDFGILSALVSALQELNIPRHNVAVVSGIGCGSKINHFINTYGFHTMHGRILPIASGIKISNQSLTVVGVGGDGDGYGIGIGHFVHAGRRNLDLTYIVCNNGIYALTKGQASPTLRKGLRMKTMATASIIEGINPIALAIIAGYTFVARAYSLDVKYEKEIFKAAITHRGMALVDVLQTCPSYNDLNTKEWYAGFDLPSKQSRIYRLEEAGYDGVVKNPQDELEVARKKTEGILKALESGPRIPTGVFYKVDLPTFMDNLTERMPSLKDKPLVEMNIYNRDIQPIIESFM